MPQPSATITRPSARRWFNRGPGVGRFLLLTLILATALDSCVPVRSRSEVVGVYELKGDKQKITLEVSPGGTFVETIVFASRQTEKRAGRWYWAKGHIGFDGLWIPKPFAPDYILRADSEARGNEPRYTEPEHWSLPAESHWGTITLPVFPDPDISFTMVRHGS